MTSGASEDQSRDRTMSTPRRKPAVQLHWQAKSAWIKPRLQRLRELLEIAANEPRSETAWGRPGVKLHCEGGRAYKGDVEELVRRGYLKIVRVPYSRVWAPQSHTRNPAHLRYTNAEITDAGRAYLATLR